MSLINDALKQASRSPRTAAATAGASPGAAGGLRPVEGPRAGLGKSVVLPLLLVVVLAGAGWFLWQWWSTRGTDRALNFASLVESAKTLIPGAKPAAGTTAATPASTAPVTTVAGTPPAAALAAEAKPQGNFLTRVFNKTGNAAPAAAPAAGFPTIKLQGIYYRAGDSTVLINGKNLTEGEQIEGVTVAKIDRQTVTLEYQGATKELKLH